MVQMTNFSPLEDRLLVRPIKKNEVEKTEGGIIIPDSAKKEVAEGEVFSVGPGRYAYESGVFIPTWLHKGDIVLYGKNQGMPIDIPGEDGKREEMRLLRESDVLLLISKKQS